MKKTMKRTLAIVMAVAMLFALSATAFAAGTASLQIVYLGTNLQVVGYNIPNDGATVYDAVTATYASYNPGWETVPDYYVPDLEWEALISMTINNQTYSTRAMTAAERTTYSVPTATWSNNPNYEGYGLVSVDNDGYTYIYAGFDWTYTVNGTPIYNHYMEDFELSNGDVVVLTYAAQIVTWPQEDPIPDFFLP